jgi:hypothetical protein
MGSKKRPEPAVLARGKRFHRQVQAAYVAGQLGVELDHATEQTVHLSGNRRGRADILLLVSKEPERQLFVVEIKSTRWEGRPDQRSRALLRRHLAQLQDYLDVLVARIGGDVDAVVAALLYPLRPSDHQLAVRLENLALAEGIMLVWYADVDWAASVSLPDAAVDPLA